MTERAVILTVALLIVGLSLFAMGGAHQLHYRNRKFQMLEGRVDVLERIVGGEHG